MRLKGLVLDGAISNTLSSLLLAFVLALLVWFTATNNQLQRLTYPATREAGLPIELMNIPEGMVVTDGEDQRLQVQLLMPRERVGEITVNDLVARVDLSERGAGSHQVEVIVERQEGAPPFRILERDPNRIVVQLDEVITRQLSIDVSVTDSALLPANYQVLTPTVSPPTVTLTGPRTVVERVEAVVAELEIGAARTDITRTVRPVLLGERGEMSAEEIEMDVDDVTVLLPVQQRQGFRELIVRTVIEGTPAPGYWVSSYDSDPDLVTIVGQPPAVAALGSIVDTAPINVEGLGEGEFIRNVPLELPDTVSPFNESFVRVRIIIEPQTSSKRVTLTPEVIGLQPGLVVTETGIIPPTVDALLKGPIIELDELDITEVVATLDLTGIGPGTHLITPQILPPGTLRAESLTPEQVEVTVIEQRESRDIMLPVEAAGVGAGEIAVLEPVSVTLSLEGTVAALERFAVSGNNPRVDVAGLTGGPHIMSPTLTINDGITITSWLPPTVTARLFDESDLLVFSAPVNVVNASEGLNVTLSSPTVIVRVGGPGTAGALSRSPDFAVELDVAGLDVGSAILRPRIRLPEGYTLISHVPEAIEARLQR